LTIVTKTAGSLKTRVCVLKRKFIKRTYYNIKALVLLLNPDKKVHAFGMSEKIYTEEEIQKAKDFLWKYLSKGNKALAVQYATTDTLSKLPLEVALIEVGYRFK